MGFWEGKEAPILQRIEIKGAIQGIVCASLHKKESSAPQDQHCPKEIQCSCQEVQRASPLETALTEDPLQKMTPAGVEIPATRGRSYSPMTLKAKNTA